jgi:hypothetical protein
MKPMATLVEYPDKLSSSCALPPFSRERYATTRIQMI